MGTHFQIPRQLTCQVLWEKIRLVRILTSRDIHYFGAGGRLPQHSHLVRMTDSIFLGHYLFHLIRTFFSLPLSSFFRSYFQFCFSFLHHYKILSFLTSSYSFLLSFLNLLLFQLYHSVFNCFLISSYFLSFLTFFPLWNRDPYRKQTSKLNDAGKCHWVTGCRTKNGHEM